MIFWSGCEGAGMAFRSFPIPDREVPASPEAFRTFLLDVVEDLRVGRSVAIHCRAGIGRSALLAACVLTAQGIDVDHAFPLIARGRGCPVPDTPEQRAWVAEFAGTMRRG